MRRNKNRVTYSSCLHDQQDLYWGNTSRDTSEESQESQKSSRPQNKKKVN